MTDATPTAVVERRVDALRTLVSAPASTTDVATRLDVSRSTADRALRELATVGFVTADDDGYRPTVAGRAALDAYDRYTRQVEGAADAAALFDGVSLGFDVDPAVFDGARVVEARPHAPNRPVECLAALVADATHASVYAGRAPAVRVCNDRLRDGMTGTVIVSERALDRKRASDAGDWRATGLERAAIRRTDRDDPVALVLAETDDGPEMGLVVFSDEMPRGFVGADDPAPTRWARALHERVWAEATPLDG
ncbi:helix-turn-helix transcriptional regulator [Haloplanus sp. C73]|uniref:helix-turn-helix transcriptional regulator n=1 Tax=Haloplanus sp. C73 TaxID=3421641 RepID=UPI003EBB5DE8